ncbi:unnamed protein product [Urochloa humidicola]
MSFNTKLVAAGFTLALLVASHGVTACERTGVWCDPQKTEMCVVPCKGKGPPKCSTEHVVGDPSCVCGDDCATTATGDDPMLEKPATTTMPGRRGMGILN